MKGLLFVALVSAMASAVIATQPAGAAPAIVVTKSTAPQSTGNVAFYAPTYSSTWYTGVSYTIMYSTTNFPSTSQYVQISYQGLYDNYWTTIVYSSSITGSYYWYVPSYLSSGQYRIQVQDTAYSSNAVGTSDYFYVNGDSNTTAALAVGWIVFIVIAVCCCVACAVCVQYRRRQAYWAANNRYAAMGTTTTTVIIPPPGQPAMQQPGANPAMIYAPDPSQQYNPYQPPQNQQPLQQQQQPPAYNPYAPQQNQGMPQGMPQYLPPGQYPGAQPGAGQYVVPVYAAPPAYGQVTPVTPVTVVHAQGGATSGLGMA